MDRRLFEASVMGNVPALQSLVQEDSLILDRISLAGFSETPLHVAALRGHLEFVRALLNLKPKLSAMADSSGRLPLHLACAEGHVDIVKELVLKMSSKPQVASMYDQDGRTPLDLAAINGHVEVVRVLVNDQPELAKKALDSRESILHLCLKHGSFEALKILVEKFSSDDLVNCRDDGGNTILHLAVFLKQIETVKYLLWETCFRESHHQNLLNGNSSSALDVIDYCPRDWRSVEIREMLMRAGAQKATDLENPVHDTSTTRVEKLTGGKVSASGPQTSVWEKLSRFWVNYEKRRNNWLEQSRSTLVVASAITAAMAFQAGLNPPGGFWQTSGTDNTPPYYISYNPGMSISAATFPDDYSQFFIYNTTSLLASLTTILLLISGFAFKNRFFVWLLMMTIIATIFTTYFTYLHAVDMLVSEAIQAFYWTAGITFYGWICICGLFALFHTIPLVAWMVRKISRLIISFCTCKISRPESGKLASV